MWEGCETHIVACSIPTTCLQSMAHQHQVVKREIAALVAVVPNIQEQGSRMPVK